jgi:hypothetical protein
MRDFCAFGAIYHLRRLRQFTVASKVTHMAHILVRKYSSGTTRYTANVRIRKGKEVVHRESKTFEQRSAAEKWAKSREVALEDPAALKNQLPRPTSISVLPHHPVQRRQRLGGMLSYYYLSGRGLIPSILFLDNSPCALDVWCHHLLSWRISLRFT